MSTKSSVTSFLCATAIAVGSASGAVAQFVGEEFKIEKFCEFTSDRRTIVYIDEGVMVEGQVEWAGRLREKLRASLMPSEPVVVVALNTIAGSAEEVWTGCFPDYTDAHKNEIFTERRWWEELIAEDPLELVKKQREVFFGQFIKALQEIYDSANRSAESVAISIEEPPSKNILGALISDEARFSRRERATRVIVYSDALENSTLGSVFDITNQQQDITQIVRNLGMNFGQAIFYVFGVGMTVENPSGVITTAKGFWKDILTQANGHLAAFGADLAVSSSRPITREVCEFNFIIEDRRGVGRLQLMRDADGILHDSYVSVTGFRSSLVEGSYDCSEAGSCVLTAKVLSKFLSDSEKEEIHLQGTRQSLEGSLVVPNHYLEGTDEEAELPISATCTN